MDLKPALSYEEQVDRLIDYHKLGVRDKGSAIEILKVVNYYRLSGYGVGLKQKDNPECFIGGTTLEHIFALYCFDSQLKNNLIHTIEQIEIALRTQIAHRLAMVYGADALYDKDNYLDTLNKDGKSIYGIINQNLEKEIKHQHNVPFVRHHEKNYEGKFPVWVSVELMSFGTLSSLYSILKPEDKKSIASLYRTTPNYLKNWILCLVEVRNICAHYIRLYNMPLKQTPRLYREHRRYRAKQNKLFPILLIIKRMLNSNQQWDSLLADIRRTIKKHEGSFRFSYMGFPNDWESILGE